MTCTIILMLAITTAFGEVTIQKNVIFQQMDVVSTTDARWLITFFIDTNPFLTYVENYIRQ